MNKLFFLATALITTALFAATDIELTPSGSFEQPYQKTFHIRRLLRDAAGKVIAHPEGAITDRVQSEKVFAGTHALLLEAQLGGHEINSNRDVLQLLPNAKYEFSFRYYIAAKGPETRISGRVIFELGDGKYKYLFPEGDNIPGKWHQLKVQFYPPAGTVRMSTTLWFSNGPYKIYVDDIRVAALAGSPAILIGMVTQT